MTKLVADFKYGTLSAGIGSTDTTITSAEFADLPVVSSPDTMDLVLNPGEVGGDAEIVTVTAHTSASTSVTVAARTGSAHGSGTQWVHAVTAADFNRMGFDGNLEGNADTATALETARTIGGVSFDGTANINLPGVNTAGNQDTSGNAATATALETARTVGGVSFDGTANINLPGVNTAGNQDTSGNAATATALQTARTINGTSFDGTANITVTAAAGTLTGSTLASGVTASSLTSVGTLSGLTVSGDANFDSGTLFVDVSTNRVGVNDTTPSYELDVAGQIRATSNIRGNNYYVGVSSGGIYKSTNSKWMLYGVDGSYMRVYDSGGSIGLGINDTTTTGGGSAGNGYVGIHNECGGFSGTAAQVTTTTVAGATMKRIGFLSSSLEYKFGVEDLSFSDEAFMALKPISFHPNDTYVDEDGSLTERVGGHVQVVDPDEAAGLMPLRRAGFGWEDLLSNSETQLIATDFSYDYGALCSVLVLKLQEAMERVAALEAG